MSMVGVTFVRQEVSCLLPVWWMIRDCIEGEQAIKGEYGLRVNYVAAHKKPRNNADYYLPRPNPTDTSLENKKRYEQYVKRAVFYNFTGRTLSGLVGQIFLRPPVSTIPETLTPLVTNADSEGMTLEQLAKRTCSSVLAYGRAGLWTDYPATEVVPTKAELKQKGIQPAIHHFYPWQIINWGTIQKGGQKVLGLVVIEELEMRVADDGFTIVPNLIYRELRLVNGVYTVQMWEDNGTTGYAVTKNFVPKKNDGTTFDYIPFKFVGSETNDVWPDVPPLADIAFLNIAHYRNSADHEESCFFVGQPTPVLTGLTEHWVKEVLKDKILLGSRGSIALPQGGEASLLQASENQLPLKAMEMKENQAVALGAKLVQAKMKVRTATEVVVDTTSEASTLHNVAKNTTAAIEESLGWAAEFAGGESDIKYVLNTEFELTRMDAGDRLAAIKAWQSGAISWTELRAVLKTDGLASQDDDEALAEIKEEQSAALTMGGAQIADPLQAVTPTAPANAPNPAATSTVPQ